MTTALTTIDALHAAGLATGAEREVLEQVVDRFRLRITPEMAGVESGGVAAQFVPDARELLTRPEELADPIGDRRFSPAPGLTHRYADRVILAVTQACEVYCRFCFRRETVGAAGVLPEADFQHAVDYIARTPAIREVILTGGDPLSLSPRRLDSVLARLEAVPHVESLRIHSRVPVVAPARMDGAMLAALDREQPVHLVIHTNHPDAMTPAAQAANRAAKSPEADPALLARAKNQFETYAAAHPDRCLVLQYEDYVADPAVLRDPVHRRLAHQVSR